jgi:hypothetical protein
MFGNILIEDIHPALSSSSKASRAKRTASAMASLLTSPLQSSTMASQAMPVATCSRTSVTRMRVPTNVGFSPHTACHRSADPGPVRLQSRRHARNSVDAPSSRSHVPSASPVIPGPSALRAACPGRRKTAQSQSEAWRDRHPRSRRNQEIAPAPGQHPTAPPPPFRRCGRG